MAQQLQDFIDKIKSDGIQAAQQKANEIQQQAQQKTDAMIRSAQEQADQMIAHAKQEMTKLEESTRMALKQSSRDLLLSLRKDIENTLHKVISADVKDTLNTERLSAILDTIINKYLEVKSQENIEVILSEEDLDALKDGFIARLQNELKGRVTVRSSGSIGKGFAISYDGGKSCFDFTDESLAEFLSAYVNTQVAGFLKESISS